MAQSKFQVLLDDFPAADRPAALELQVRLLRGYAQAALGRRDEARKAFEDAATFDPKSPRPLAGLARIDLDGDKIDAAETLLQRALVLGPESAETLSLLGETARRRAQPDQALDYYSRALQHDGRNRTALTGRALQLLDRNDTDKAEADIKALLSASANNPIAHYLRALSQAQRKDPKAALATLQKQQGLVNYAPAVFLQSVLQVQEKQLEQAVAGFERYVELQPSDIRARKLLANLYMRRNDTERAVKVLTPALETVPDDLETLSLLGGAYLAQRQYDRATELLGRAAAIDPNNAQVQTRLAAGQLQAGEPASAMKALEQAISLNPSETEANLLLVMTHLRDRKFAAAREAAERFRGVQPKSPVPLAMLGTIARTEGDRRAARGFFEQAVALQPDYTAGHMALAQLDLDDGKPADARRATTPS
jgi:putative PEP-CTERM system TPR-repeat lipoprotein